MKKSLLVLFSAAVCFNIYAFDTASVLQVKGNVKEYTKIDYTITEKFGDYYRSPKAKYVHVFDSNGRQTETSELTAKDLPVDRLTYTYDEKGNLTTTTGFDSEGKLSWKIVTVYDSENLKKEESELNASDMLVNKSIWKYSPLESEEAYYNADGALLGKTITKFDEQNREVEVATYSADGKLDVKRAYTYNDAGFLSETVYTDAQGLVTSKVVNRFDEKYNITEEQTYENGKKLSKRTIFKYDEKGNVSRITVYEVSQKFGTTVNELIGINEFSYVYGENAKQIPVVDLVPARDAK